MPYRPADAILPLTPLAFEILLALHDDDLHGYAILQVVEARSRGLLPLRTGTLYRALARLLDDGLIKEVPEPGQPSGDDDRRRYYRITPHGRDVARAEARRLADQVAAARARKLLPGPHRS
jgi:DNA-binding PadR family transcriptional regulator